MFNHESRRQVLNRLAAVIGAPFVSALAVREANAAWPERVVKIVVPFAAGGTPDLAARVLSERLFSTFGKSFVVENKAGAGGTIAVLSVAKADPDGYTLLLCTGAFVVNHALNASIGYDPMADFTPLTEVATSPNLFVVNSRSPAKTIGEFVELARKSDKPLMYASPGIGTTPQLSTELLKKRGGIDLVHVPFNSGPQAIESLLTERVQFACMSVSILQPHVESGALRALAVTGDKRWKDLPVTPTMIEAGYKDFVVDTMLALLGPKGLPAEIAGSLSEAAQKILKEPDVIKKLEFAGLTVIGGTASQLSTRIRQDMTMWGAAVQQIGIRK